jgi:4-hydroxybenzoate polyprenyltransferase
MLYAVFWTWLHLLQFCISNQSLDPEEDASNKPWRPIPSGLVSVARARTLRWILLFSCFSLSVRLRAHWQGASLALAFLAHNELHLHSHWLMRNVCNAWGYASFNAGASAIAAGAFDSTPPPFDAAAGRLVLNAILSLG